jgi:hypothetical protein
MCGYVACVPECRGSVCCASQLGAYGLSWEAQQSDNDNSKFVLKFYFVYFSLYPNSLYFLDDLRNFVRDKLLQRKIIA